MLLVPHPKHPVTDPRDNLDKARRPEIYKFAQENGVKEITPEWPASGMRLELRKRGLTNIKIPHRIFGTPDNRTMLNSNGAPMPVSAQTQGPVEVDAAADLMRQVASGAYEQPPPDYSAMTRAELAKTCKARGIKMARTDKKEILMEKLRGQVAA
jgi:hypothetical protein